MDSHIDESLATLTDAQTAQVAGGLTIIIIEPSPGGGGCRTCTSGKAMMFKNEVAAAAK